MKRIDGNHPNLTPGSFAAYTTRARSTRADPPKEAHEGAGFPTMFHGSNQTYVAHGWKRYPSRPMSQCRCLSHAFTDGGSRTPPHQHPREQSPSRVSQEARPSLATAHRCVLPSCPSHTHGGQVHTYTSKGASRQRWSWTIFRQPSPGPSFLPTNGRSPPFCLVAHRIGDGWGPSQHSRSLRASPGPVRPNLQDSTVCRQHRVVGTSLDCSLCTGPPTSMFSMSSED